MNIRLKELVHLLQGFPCKTVIQHLASKIRVHCLEGDVDGGQPVTTDSVNIVLRHICQRHIIPLQEGKSGIIILKIQGFSHPRRHLVNKTEDALIMAVPVFIHQTVLKLNAKILVKVLIDLQHPLLPVRLLDQNLNIGILDQKLVVKNILDLRIIYGEYLIARFNFQLLRNAARKNRFHNVFFLHAIPHSTFLPYPVPHQFSPGTIHKSVCCAAVAALRLSFYFMFRALRS